MDNNNTTDILSIIVRLLGLAMMLIGLYVGIKVIFEAWYLYEEPQRIERFADAIEHGSNLDAILASVTTDKTIPKAIDSTTTSPAKNTPPLKVTYFLAWGIVVILLMVVGSLASTTIKTGGQLALYDLQVKRFANQLLKQANSTKE